MIRRGIPIEEQCDFLGAGDARRKKHCQEQQDDLRGGSSHVTLTETYAVVNCADLSHSIASSFPIGQCSVTHTSGTDERLQNARSASRRPGPPAKLCQRLSAPLLGARNFARELHLEVRATRGDGRSRSTTSPDIRISSLCSNEVATPRGPHRYAANGSLARSDLRLTRYSSPFRSLRCGISSSPTIAPYPCPSVTIYGLAELLRSVASVPSSLRAVETWRSGRLFVGKSTRRSTIRRIGRLIEIVAIWF
jgi:hypothetical protein